MMDATKLATSISSDLRQLSSLTKRSSYQSIKESTENAIHNLHELGLSSRVDHSDLVKLCPQIVSNFITACEGKPNVKVLHLSLAAIHRLVQYSLVDENSVEGINNLLCSLSENKIEELRVIQTTLLLINNNQALQAQQLSKALVNIIKLCASKNVITSNTAGAAVKQIIIAMFERVNSPVEKTIVTDLEYLMKDLSLFLKDEFPAWLIGANLQHSSVLDIIETITYRYSSIIIKYPLLLSTLKDDISNVIVDYLGKYSKNEKGKIEFLSFSKMLRIFIVLLRNYQPFLAEECKSMIISAVQFLYPGHELWKQTIAMEVLRTIFSDVDLLKNLIDNVPNEITKDTIIGFGTFIRSQFALTGSILTDNDDLANVSFVYRNHKFLLSVNPQELAKNGLLDIWDKEIPQISTEYVLSIACLASQALANTIVQLIANSNENQKQIITECIWCGLLSTLCFLVEHCVDEEMIPVILTTLRNLSLSWPVSSIAYRESLRAQCRLVLPSNYLLECLTNQDVKICSGARISLENDKQYMQKIAVLKGQSPAQMPVLVIFISFRELMACQSLIVFTFESLLNFDVNMWLDILCTFQHFCWIVGYTQDILSGLVFQQIPSGSVVYIHDHALEMVEHIIGEIKSLFCENRREIIPLNKIIQLIEALSLLGEENISDAQSTKDERVCLFAVAQMIQLACFNISVYTDWWTLVMSHFHKGCASENLSTQKFYVEGMCHVLNLALKQFGTKNQFVADVLKEIELLSADNSLSVAVRAKQIDFINQLLRDHGQHLFEEGWHYVFRILDNAATEVISSDFTSNAFSCVDVMCADLFPDIPHSCIIYLLQIIAKFSQTEVNIALSAIVLLWRTVDYLSTNHKPNSDQFYLKACWILCDLCLDRRLEVRKSAVQSLIALMNTCSTRFELEDSWETLLEKCLLECLSHFQLITITVNECVQSESYLALLIGVTNFICKLRHTQYQSLQDDLLRACWMKLVCTHIKAAAANQCKFSQSASLNAIQIVSSKPTYTDKIHYLSIYYDEWLAVWKLWLFIGNNITNWKAGQASLSLFINLFDSIVLLNMSKFNCNDFENFANVIENVLTLNLESTTKTNTINLQSVCLKAYNVIGDMVRNSENAQLSILPSLFSRCLSLALKCVEPIQNYKSHEMYLNPDLIIFGEQMFDMVETLYERFYQLEIVMNDNVLQSIINSFGVQMAKRHKCASSSTWKLLATKFIKTSKLGLFYADQNGRDVSQVCDDLMDYVEPFLLSSSDLRMFSLQECEESEEIDCELLDLLNLLLTTLHKPPSQFILRSMELMECGCTKDFRTTDDFIDIEAIECRRKLFIAKCFQTIVDCSKKNEIAEVRLAAVNTMLKKAKETIIKYAFEEKVLPDCLLTRSISTDTQITIEALIDFLKHVDEPILTTNSTVWSSIQSIYPNLIECTRVNDSTISGLARVALHQFQRFLSPSINY